TSAQVALDILTEQKSPALIKIRDILIRDDFVTSSTWADEIRGSTTQDWKSTIWYHFEKMNDGDKYLTYLKDQVPDVKSRGGVVTALMAGETVLKDKKATAADKNSALKFLIHFIGGIHQPFHTGRVDDNGGNKIEIKWQGFDLSLHQVWDSQIIAFGHKDLFTQGNKTEQVKAYADFLEAKFKAATLPDENKLKYDDWLNESLIPRSDAYKYKDDEARKYTARFIDIVDMRVYLAGVRIAYTMNRLFPGYDGVSAPTAAGLVIQNNFRTQVVSITGDITKLIDLKPSPLKGN
ncbi:MAG: S1/P1 nuclease, partial [Bdellovibrionaceae bacterium]|nr:S1/P1 nuclease [Pseudobdellovibrionaceae bacterium]